MAQRRIINQTGNFTKKDALNTRNGIALQDFEGATMTLTGVSKAAMLETTDEDTGEIKNVSVLIDSDNNVYTSISSTIYDSMDDIIDIITDESQADIRINRRKAKSGREFLSAIVL